MWLLVVLCSSVGCQSDLIGVHREDTEARCVEMAEAVYAEQKITWMCIKDTSLYDPDYEAFE